MFSDNDKISLRQIKRLMLFDLFGISSLLLPAKLAQTAGSAGVWGILLAAAAGIGYLWILELCIRRMQGDYFLFLQRVWGAFLARVFYAVYAAISIGVCIYTALLLTDLMCETLLEGESSLLVFFLLLLLGVYGAAAGVEARARIYELLFWALLIPLLIMLLLCVRQVQVVRWFPFWNAGESAIEVFAGSYQAFAAFLPVSYLVFLAPYAKEPKKAGGAVCRALLWTGGALCILFLMLLGIFGAPALAGERYSAITMLGLVKLPGGFLKRLDTVMASVWFFTLYALLTTALYYGALIGQRAWYGRKKQAVRPGTPAILVTGATAGLLGFVLRRRAYEAGLWEFFYQYGIPFLLLAPVLSLLLCQWRSARAKRLAAAGMLVAAMAFLLSGCSGAELENKSFPLALLLDEKEGSCQSVYLFQQLSEISNERASGGNTTVNAASGGTYFEAQKAYEKNNRCQLDVSHTKAVILGLDFFEDAKMRKSFLEYVRKDGKFARNTLLYLTRQGLQELAELNEELEAPLGSYLEQMTENEQDIADTAVITLGTLLNEAENQDQVLLIPVLEVKNGLPVVCAYYVMEDYETAGVISVETAMSYFLMQGQLKELDLQLDGGAQVRLGNLSCQRSFSADGDQVLQNLLIKTDADYITGAGRKQEIQKEVQRQLETAWAQVRREYQADLSDSYRYLPMCAPKLWEVYKNDPDGYRAALNVRVDVQVRMER